MKRIIIFTVSIVLIAAATPVFAGARREDVPRAAYLEPKNESIIDLTGKESLTFQWKNQPIPGGGREAYRFRLYKGFSYDVVVGQDLGLGIFSISIPADKFDDGAQYSWHVEQRDASSMVWSLHDIWHFKVIKKR